MTDPATKTILEYFDVDLAFLTSAVLDNPSLRGMVLGYLAEAKLRDVLTGHGRATAFRKDDDHDRKKKGDLVLTYGGFEFKIEVKSLQTNGIELWEPSADPMGGRWVRKILKRKGPGKSNPDYPPVWNAHRLTSRYRGEFQCDASDSRSVTFADQTTLKTTNLLFGEFHVLAAGLFAFREKWDFAFILNRDLPKSGNAKYTPLQRDSLIASTVPISWPIAAPFTADIYELLDKLLAEYRIAPPLVPTPPVSLAPKKRKKKP